MQRTLGFETQHPHRSLQSSVNSSSREADTFWPLQALHADGVLTYTWVGQTHVHKKLNNKAPAGGIMTSQLCPKHTQILMVQAAPQGPSPKLQKAGCVAVDSAAQLVQCVVERDIRKFLRGKDGVAWSAGTKLGKEGPLSCVGPAHTSVTTLRTRWILMAVWKLPEFSERIWSKSAAAERVCPCRGNILFWNLWAWARPGASAGTDRWWARPSHMHTQTGCLTARARLPTFV